MIASFGRKRQQEGTNKQSLGMKVWWRRAVMKSRVMAHTVCEGMNWDYTGTN